MPLPQAVESEIAGDREQPRFKSGPTLILSSAGEHADPSLLRQIFNVFAAARKIDQISDQPVLKAIDHLADERGIIVTQTMRNPLSFALRRFRERQGIYRHTPV